MKSKIRNTPLSKPQLDLLWELQHSEQKKVVLYYGTTFIVSGTAHQAERNTVESLVKLGFLVPAAGSIKEAYKLKEEQ